MKQIRLENVMIEETNTKQNRRELLRSWGRNISLAGLGSLAGVLLRRNYLNAGSTKNGNLNGTKEKCINRSICRGCRIYDDCYLPTALSVKRHVMGQNNAREKSKR